MTNGTHFKDEGKVFPVLSGIFDGFINLIALRVGLHLFGCNKKDTDKKKAAQARLRQLTSNDWCRCYFVVSVLSSTFSAPFRAPSAPLCTTFFVVFFTFFPVALAARLVS